VKVVFDSDALVKCAFCSEEAFVLAEMTAGRPAPLCACCFASVEPEIMAAAANRDPSAGPPVRLVKRAAND
jgi:hypothetical protein